MDSSLKNPQYSADGVTLDVIPTQETATNASRVPRARDVYQKILLPRRNHRTDRTIRSFAMRTSHFTALLLACVLLFLPTVGLAVPSSLSVAVVADDHLALRPLELNQRDVVSLLGLVYEGLFEMDDNAQPQPKLAYAYSFSNDGRKLQVTLRQDVTFTTARR